MAGGLGCRAQTLGIGARVEGLGLLGLGWLSKNILKM